MSRSNPVDQFIVAIVLIIVIAAIAVIGVSCNAEGDDAGVVGHETTTGFEYETVVIEGMPCILWKDSATLVEEAWAGMTCNWDYWTASKGEWANESQQE